MMNSRTLLLLLTTSAVVLTPFLSEAAVTLADRLLSIKQSASSGYRVTSGSYTGDGVNGKAITGIGFTPSLVIIKQNGTARTVMRSSTMTGGTRSVTETANGFEANLITSLDANGFTLGTDARVNTSSSTYYWTAFKAFSGEMELGTYSGDGVDNRNLSITTFQPEVVIIFPDVGGNPSSWRGSSAGDWSVTFNGSTYSNGIQALQANGVQLGTSAYTNTNGSTYHFIAWKGITGRVASGTYVGNGSTRSITVGAGWQPEYVIISNDSTYTSAHKNSATGSSTDSSMYFNGQANAAGLIMALETTGFKVGTNNSVNRSAGSPNYYWMAFK
jgi:hypothetical protein